MTTTATLDELRRLALMEGAVLEIEGEVFNAAKTQIDAPRKPPEPVRSVAPVVPASPPHITREQVEQLVAERDQFWMGELQRVTEMIARSVSSKPQGQAPCEWTFTPTYNRGNVLQSIVAKPSC